MRKKFAFMMFFIMLSTIVLSVSCAQAETEIFDMDLTSEYSIDLTGLTFTWGSNWATASWNPTPGFSADGDRMLQRYNDLEKEYGCEFDVIQWEDSSGQIYQRVVAGIPTPDWIDTHSNGGGIQLFNSNIIVALEDIPTIDLSSDKYGTEAFRRYGVYEGKSYGFTPYLWDYGPEFAGICAFNTEMISSFGCVSPYELKEKGEWNWENFRQLLLDIQVAEAGVNDNFSPLMIREIWETVKGLWFSNDLQIVETTSNNTTLGVNNSHGYYAVEYLKGLFDDELCSIGEARNFSLDEYCAIQFNQANLVSSYMNRTTSSGYATEADFAYGVMPYPYGPNGNPDSHSGYVYNGRRLNYVIAFSGNEIEDIGTVLEYVYAPLDNSVGWKEYLAENVFWDKRDSVNYNYMIDNIYYDYSTELNDVSGNFSNAITKAVRGKATVSEAFNSVLSQINQEINENIVPFLGD
ncbi:MAG: hypothetical protein J6D42_12130 [Clostridia bacterium]|nr:hypothetical protein [Clostridia bacterium]